MRLLQHLSFGVLIGATCAALSPAATHAQSCDYQVVSATWHPHPDPSMIYVDFAVDVSTDFPVSADSTHPSEFPVQVAIRFNGALMVAPQDLIMLWWQRTNNCTGSPCPAVVCAVKQWQFTPATPCGKPLAQTITVPIVFQIEK